jgi:uncharacterized protein
MTHPNEELLREGYAAFAEGDVDTVMGLFADDIKWHVSGRSMVSGDYKGKEEVGAFFGKMNELSNGTFRVELRDVLANDDHGAVLLRETAQREGKSIDSNHVHVWRLRDGKAAEFWDYPSDQKTDEEFWS